MGYEQTKILHERDEREFGELMSKFGEVLKSSPKQDRFDHFDLTCQLFNESGPKRVDVKSVKRKNRNDVIPNDKIHWVEETNVNGKKGWLFGKADYFAFQTNKQWVIVKKKKLQDLIKEKCPDPKIYSYKKLYKRYRRINKNDPEKSRFDSVILIETSELIKISELIYDRDINYVDINDIKEEIPQYNQIIEFTPKTLISIINPIY
jgi:hypothetical protein